MSYLMDDPREAKRLAEKVDAAAWIAKHVTPNLREGAAVLDVGCGPGVIPAEIARAHPGVVVTAFDASASRLEVARENLKPFPSARTVQGDAAALPFEDASFDFVHCRFLLEYLPDKQRAVSEMARVCKPGGLAQLHDLDGQLVWHDPVDAELQEGIEKVVAVMSKTGFDPFVGRKLFSLARNAGLSDVVVDVSPYHLFAGRIDDKNRKLWETKLEIALPQITAALGNTEKAKDLKAAFISYLLREDSLTYSVLFSEVHSGNYVM